MKRRDHINCLSLNTIVIGSGDLLFNMFKMTNHFMQLNQDKYLEKRPRFLKKEVSKLVIHINSLNRTYQLAN